MNEFTFQKFSTLLKTTTLLKICAIALMVWSCSPNSETQSTHSHSHTPSHETTDRKPQLIRAGEGKIWNIFGVEITGLVMAEETRGAYTVISTETPPNGGPPLHVHEREDELFYVLKGQYTFYCGEDTLEASRGDYVLLPRGIPHRFENVDTVPGITVNTISPGGMEAFFDLVAEASAEGRPSRETIDSLAGLHGITFLVK
ncbi:MAG: hypothetical protein SchgKO_16120 [Schleiferiaceae bacterium]